MYSDDSAVRRVVSDFVTMGPEELERYSVDGLTPKAAVIPQNSNEVSEIMKRAGKERVSVTPWGGGTMMGLGGIPKRLDLVLLLQNLNKVIEYAPEDLVVSVEAGTKLDDLESILGRKKQFLPLDPPYASRATFGGITSVNSFGSKRYIYGGVRDLLLGVQIVHSDGTTSKAGGKVMKNVAGYDMKKLYIGSLGTLGVIIQTTFKVYPIPFFEATLISSFTSPYNYMRAVEEILTKVHSSIGVGPFAIEVFDATSSQILHELGFDLSEGYTLCTGVFSMAGSSMKMRLTELETIAKMHSATATYSFEGNRHNRFWRTVQDLPAFLLEDGFSILCKVSTSISKTGEAMLASQSTAVKHNLRSAVFSHMGLGIFYFLLSSSKLDEAVRAIQEIRSYVSNSGGSLVVEVAPLQIKQKIDVWGPTRKDFPLMQAIKNHFDPNGILNPGRFVGGI